MRKSYLCYTYQPRKWREKEASKTYCDGMAALRELRNDWEKNGEQEQKIEGTGKW